jgi:hypothetical protein
MDGPVDARSQSIKNHGQKFTLRLIKHLGRRQPVTLLCHCAENETRCHRHELRRVMKGKGQRQRAKERGKVKWQRE